VCCAQYGYGKTSCCESDAPLRQTKMFSEAPSLSANPHFCLLYRLRKSVDGSRFYSGIKCIDNVDKIFSDTNPTPQLMWRCYRFWHSENRASWYILTIKANEMHYFSNLFDKVLYMFRTGQLSITRSISTLYRLHAISVCHASSFGCLLACSSWTPSRQPTQLA
jgi:hypothetical protein